MSKDVGDNGAALGINCQDGLLVALALGQCDHDAVEAGNVVARNKRRLGRDVAADKVGNVAADGLFVLFLIVATDRGGEVPGLLLELVESNVSWSKDNRVRCFVVETAGEKVTVTNVRSKVVNLRVHGDGGAQKSGTGLGGLAVVGVFNGKVRHLAVELLHDKVFVVGGGLCGVVVAGGQVKKLVKQRLEEGVGGSKFISDRIGSMMVVSGSLGRSGMLALAALMAAKAMRARADLGRGSFAMVTALVEGDNVAALEHEVALVNYMVPGVSLLETVGVVDNKRVLVDDVARLGFGDKKNCGSCEQSRELHGVWLLRSRGSKKACSGKSNFRENLETITSAWSRGHAVG